LVHAATGLPVDIVIAGPGLEDEFFERVVTQRIDDVTVPVIEVSDLIVLKILAARPKDTEDVVTLLHIQAGAVDETRVRRLLAMLEGALGQSDLLPAFDDLLRRSRR
jgi:predicted nucleotidyltransferase